MAIADKYKVSTLIPHIPKSSYLFLLPDTENPGSYICNGAAYDVFHEVMFNLTTTSSIQYQLDDGVDVVDLTENMKELFSPHSTFYYKYEYNNVDHSAIWLKINPTTLNSIKREIVNFIYNEQPLPNGGYMEWLYKYITADNHFNNEPLLNNFLSHSGLSSYTKFSQDYNNTFVANVFNLNLLGSYFFQEEIVSTLEEVVNLPVVLKYYYFKDKLNGIIGERTYGAGDNQVDLNSLMSINYDIESSMVDTMSLLSPTYKYYVNILNSDMTNYLTTNHPNWCYKLKLSSESISFDDIDIRHHNDYYFLPHVSPSSSLKFDVELYSDKDAVQPLIYITNQYNDINLDI